VVHADLQYAGPSCGSPPVVPTFMRWKARWMNRRQVDMDPVALRRINDYSVDAMGKQWSSRSLMTCYDQAEERFGLDQPQQRAKPSMSDGDGLIGVGCASAVYRPCGCGGGAGAA